MPPKPSNWARKPMSRGIMFARDFYIQLAAPAIWPMAMAAMDSTTAWMKSRIWLAFSTTNMTTSTMARMAWIMAPTGLNIVAILATAFLMMVVISQSWMASITISF